MGRFCVREERRKTIALTETGPHPQSHAQDLFVNRVRGNPSLRFVDCLDMSTNSQSLCRDYLPTSLTASNRYQRWLWHELYALLANVHLSSVLAVGRSSKTEAKARLENFWCPVSWGLNCRAYCSIRRDIGTQDFTFPGFREGTCTSMTNSPADSSTSISVTGPIFTRSLGIAYNLEFRESLGSDCSLHEGVKLFPFIKDSWVI